MNEQVAAHRLSARIRSARSACSFSSFLVDARRDACCVALSVWCNGVLPADRTLPDVLLMVADLEVQDISLAVSLPGVGPASEIPVKAASRAAPADIAWRLSREWLPWFLLFAFWRACLGGGTSAGVTSLPACAVVFNCGLLSVSSLLISLPHLCDRVQVLQL